MTEQTDSETVFIGGHVSVEQAAWLDRMARNNGGMSRAAAIRRLIDNAMRGEARALGVSLDELAGFAPEEER